MTCSVVIAKLNDHLLNVGVVVDVIFAVAEVALTAGAVTEFQFRIGGIRSAANDAAVIVGSFVSGVG